MGFLCDVKIEEKERLKIQEPQFKVSLRPTYLQKLCLAPFFIPHALLHASEL